MVSGIQGRVGVPENAALEEDDTKVESGFTNLIIVGP